MQNNIFILSRNMGKPFTLCIPFRIVRIAVCAGLALLLSFFIGLSYINYFVWNQNRTLELGFQGYEQEITFYNEIAEELRSNGQHIHRALESLQANDGARQSTSPRHIVLDMKAEHVQ